MADTPRTIKFRVEGEYEDRVLRAIQSCRREMDYLRRGQAWLALGMVVLALCIATVAICAFAL